MKKISLLLACLFSLNAQIAVAGHTARAATGSGTGGAGIETINEIGPTNAHNFTIESADDSVTITGLPHGIDLSVPASVETVNGISPDSSGNFTVTPGTGVVITPGTNSLTISAPGGGSGVGAINADAGGFITGTSITISGGSTGLTTDTVSSTQMDVTGTLNLSHGGTNANLTASDGGIFYSTSSAGAILSGTPTANQILLSGSSSAPSWSTATYPGATTVNELLYSSSTNTVGQITTANDGVLITSNLGVPSWLPNGTTGQVLTATAGSPPSWATITTNEGVSEFVVDSQGNAGYTTIQTAIDAAALVATSTTPQTVWIWPGTYAENLTLYPFVNLASGASGVVVNGNASYVTVAASEYFYCNGIEFAPTTGSAFTVTGTGAPTLVFDSCVFKPVAGSCFFSSNGSGSNLNTIYQSNCTSNAAIGQKIYDVANSSLYLTSCNNQCTDTGSTFSGSFLTISSCVYVDNISLSSSSFAILTGSYATSVASGALFTLDGSSSMYAINSTVSTSGTYWASGTGSIYYGAITTLDGSASVNTTLTRHSETLQAGAVSFDGGITTLNPTTLTANQVVLGTATSALSNVPAGTSGQVLTSNGASAPTWQTLAVNAEGVSKFVVDSAGNTGYTTIQSAITAAAAVATSTTPQTVWVWPGTYTENVTVGSSYVNLASASVTGVEIVGNTVLNPSNSGTFTANNITFTTPGGGGSAFTFSGTHDCVPVFENCIFNGTTGDCLTVSSTSGDNVFINSCVFNASSGHKTFNFTSSNSSNFYIFSCVQNSTDTAAIIGGNSLVLINGMTGNDSFSLQNGCYVFLKNSFLQNVGSNSSFAIGASANLDISYTSVTCQTGTYWATGTGGLFYTNVNPSRGTATLIDPGLTTTGYEFQGGSISFDKGVSGLNTATQATNHQVVLGTGTSSVSTVSGTGTTGQLLTSNGAGADPTWQDNSSVQTINTLSPNGSGNFSVVAGNNISITSGTNSITINSSGLGTTTEGVSQFVVDSQGNAGYTTIQAAIDAAAVIATSTTPQTVWIWPGTYTENVVLADNVNLVSTAALTCTIIGNTTYSAGASKPSVTLKNITFQTPSGGGDALQISGSNGCNFVINDCVFNGSFGDCLSILTLGTDFYIYNSIFYASSGFKTFNFIHGFGYLFSCLSQSTDTPAVMQNLLVFFYDHFGNDSFILTNNVYCFFKSCFLASLELTSLFEIQSGSTLDIDNTSMTCYSGNGFWASGVSGSYGNINYNGISPSRGSATEIDPLLNIGNYQMQVGNISFDGGLSSLNTKTQATNHQVVLGTGTSSVSTVSGTGTTGQLLTSNGAGADPTWQDNSSVQTINTLSPNGSGNFSVVAGNNISITSGTNSITINSSGLGTTTEGVSQFVVDSGGTQGYTTIQAAINAAAAVATSTTPQTVWIWPGTYTEDLTMVSYVNLSAAAGDSVFVTGNAIYSPSADNQTVFVHNLVFNTPATGDAFSMGDIGASNIYFSQCVFNATNGSGAGISGTNPNGAVKQYLCLMNASAGNQNYNVTVGVNAYSTNTNGGEGSYFLAGGTVGWTFFYCTFVETLTVFDKDLIMNDCLMISNNVVVNSGGHLYARNCLFDTGSQYWATGTGAVSYGAILTGVPLDPALTSDASNFQTGPVSFDGGSTFFDSLTQGTNHQILLGTGTSAISTVSGTGTTGQVLTSAGAGADPTWTTISANNEGVSEFVVDSQGGAGYTTIQDAINAAALIATSTTPQTVWIWPGTYAEGGTLTLYPFVNLASAAGEVIITAACSLTSSGASDRFVATLISFQATSGDCFTINQTNMSGIANIVFNLCTFEPVTGSCLVATAANPGSPTITQISCGSNSNHNAPIYSIDGFNLNILNCNNNAYGSNSNHSNISNNAGVSIIGCGYGDTFNLTNNSFVLIQNSSISTLGFGPGFILDNTSSIFISACNFIGVEGNYISGTGTVNYSGLTFTNCTNPTLQASSITAGQFHTGELSFDQGISYLDTNTQCSDHQVVLGTGTSALNVVSGTGTTGQVLTSNGAGANPTWQNSGSILTVTGVSYTQSPYTVLTTDYYLKCSVPSTPFNPLTINLPAAPTTGQVFVIKDSSGHAFTNHITIAPLGGVLIDGSASYILNKNYQSASVLFDGAAYEIFSSYGGQ